MDNKELGLALIAFIALFIPFLVAFFPLHSNNTPFYFVTIYTFPIVTIIYAVLLGINQYKKR
jgi:drug/metabolite transporter (DMT)-like permease